jgi:hypothetical protein
VNRAARRQAKRWAAELAARGFYERNHRGEVVRVTDPATVGFLRDLAERVIRGGKAVVERVGDARAAPMLAPEAPDGATVYVAGGIDGEGRFSWSSDWVLSTADPDTELELTKTLLLSRLGSWCATPGFGDLEPRGRA